MQYSNILHTDIHQELRILIQNESRNTGEMSIRPRIQRAIEKLITGKDINLISQDILLMHQIAGYNPSSRSPQVHTIYDESLMKLANIMNQRGLYAGETEWTKEMTKTS